jgi:hypothetical protein
MFDFVIYKYFEIKKWLIDMFTFTDRARDDRYIVISGYGEDIWLLE